MPEPPERVGPTRSAAWLRADASLPIWSCSVWGLPCRSHYCLRGALLPHLFTLTGLAVQAYALRASLPGAPGPSLSGTGEDPARRYVFCGTGRPRALKPVSRTLSGTLPCGVRTFLSRKSQGAPEPSSSDRPVLLPVIVYRGCKSGCFHQNLHTSALAPQMSLWKTWPDPLTMRSLRWVVAGISIITIGLRVGAYS